MKKNIFSILLMTIVIFLVTGCGNKSDIIENKISNTEKALIEDGYVLFEGNIDTDMFKDVSYVISSPFTNTSLIVKSDGSIFKYNLKKKFSNDSNIIGYNSKFNGEVLLGMLDSYDSDKIFWLFDKEKQLYKFDSTTDQLSKENDLDNDVVFRGNEFDDALKNISFDSIFRQTNDNIYLLKENELYRFYPVGIVEFNANPFIDSNIYHINIDLNNEKIEYMDNDFLKTDKNYYSYQYVESEYADQESGNQYVKLKVSKYKDDILYINKSIAILQNEKVYMK